MAVLNRVVRGFTGARGLTAFTNPAGSQLPVRLLHMRRSTEKPATGSAGLIRRSVQDQAPAAAGLQLHRVDFTEPADVLGRPGHQDEAFVLSSAAAVIESTSTVPGSARAVRRAARLTVGP